LFRSSLPLTPPAKEIDLLSIDTEGSEFLIRQNFDFTQYSFHVVVCEHNYTRDRERILAVLEW
jgi:methyltransferase FkbM-like protein